MTIPVPPGKTEGPGPEEPAVSPDLERAAERARSWRGFRLALPSYVYLIFLFAVPLILVGVYSFASRSRTGAPELANWNLESIRKLADPTILQIAWRSTLLALLTTVICLLVAYPFAYYIATRSERARNLLLVFVMIPFWSNFLVRTYAWKVLLGADGLFTRVGEALGLWGQLLFTMPAVLIGLVYGFLPFMVLPLYASIERLDWSLVEAGRDLYASGWKAFRRITLPLSRPGIIAGSILVFIPSLGAYVTPDILGGAKTTLLGNYIVNQFLAARNWPLGSSVSMAIMIVMLLATVLYFRSGAKTL
jgi:spermidine/putrescine transport system permease protein